MDRWYLECKTAVANALPGVDTAAPENAKK